ncbi:MAG: hypothetical protein QNJ94_02185 [Alphaproteobacteria bacterium]|nr:hypothetical protein [Alphaproteobacteria bacterium]
MRPYKALLLAFALMISAGTVQAETIKWRIATFDRETGAYWNNFMVPYVELVKELTDGRMVLEPLPGGALGNIFKIYEQVDDGLVEMAMMPAAFLGTKDPFNAIAMTMPTGLGVDSIVAWLYFGGGEELVKGHRAERMGMHAMILGAGPSEFFAHSHVPVTKVEDLENLKYRTLGNWAAIVKDKFAASPTTVPGPEIYGLLEKKGLDLTEYSTPGENFKLGLHEVAEYIIYPGIHAGAFAFEAVAKLEKWKELPPDIQQKMAIAARLVTYDGMNRFIMGDLAAMEKLAKGKNKFIKLSPEFQAKAQVAARDWARAASEKAAKDGNPWSLKAFESITAFQDNWRRNSKYMAVDYRPE